MKRYAFRMKIKKGFEEEYVRRHKEVWRDVEKATVEAGIHNYSIFKDGRELFAYLESEDYEKAAKTLAAHQVQLAGKLTWQRSWNQVVLMKAGKILVC
ncbi:L-rhamnose mutarotase [Geomicrobium sp. JCM 19039]|uniref:L-rhamnose mutarotase n=1 Tax=Geomicrobium sp. JCM 19039 TaxID=1460636 RepID=UPI00045F2AD2|nr:L-rhamnose mutarotase [Geomicrobium sp. JCM 19039]GAK12106.1 L-rhamnose mutarotase [Geomicrobium sp. JCM 19039]